MQDSPASSQPSQCRTCSRTFARPDHLRRHEISHVRPKAMSCTVCHRKFTRMDGLQRHCRTVHNVDRRASPPTADSPTSPKRPRLDDASPDAIQQVYHESDNINFDSEDVQELDQDRENADSNDDDVLVTATRGTRDIGLALAVAEAFPGLWPDVRDFLSSTTHEGPIDENEGMNYTQSNTLIRRHRVSSPSVSSRLGFEADRPLDGPFPTFEFPAPLDEMLSDRHTQSLGVPFGFGFQAWTRPSPDIVRANLSSPSVPRTFQNGTCSVDEILTNIDIASLVAAYKTHSYPNIPLLHLPTFRLFSADLSTTNLQDCISNPRLDPSAAPFNSRYGRKLPRCLLYSIIALGAAYSLCPILAQRFFEETGSEVRKYLKRSSFESSDMPPPDVSIIQAFIQYIQFCFCEGNQVLEQVAVQHICCLASLVQDAGLGKLNVTMPPSLHPEDAVSSDWHTWALFEERKRTYFCAYFVCSAGLTLINPAQPFIGHSHIELELPCREALWEADTEEQWKALGIEAADVCPLQSTLSSLFPPKIDTPPDTSIDMHALGSVDRTVKMAIAMIAAHTVQQPAMESPMDTARLNHDLISNVSEFGCLVLILALNESVWAWRKQQQGHEETSPQEAKQLRDFKYALDTWQEIWQRLPKRKTDLTLGDKVLLGCLPIFDHTKLALQVDISLAKDALHSRNYQRTNAIFKSIFDGSVGSDNASLTPPNENLAAAEQAEACGLCARQPYTECREVASYAISALRLSHEMAPWWSEGGEAFDVPVISAITAFHCTQIVCGWLSYVAATRGALEAHEQDINTTSDEPTTMQMRHHLDPEDIQLIQAVVELLGSQDINVQRGGFEEDMDKVLEIAENLYHLQAQMFERVVVWPLMNHLAKGLRISASLLPKHLTRTTQSPVALLDGQP
ncbi:hypothetical protein BU16DRAFT_558216 [Lophium mytilinum]|uniref:C2H2-type domain-containing protein n=1 Tax=Lophium mytilinum TaxID=390894 RepID=A0A6A6R2K5_9PEZI|nr:hypothetical protein BU16DRAFT_558216 [Lophium mytilinum]